MSGSADPPPSDGAGSGRGWVSQARIYLREMYPPLPRLLLSAVWFYAVYLGLAAYHGDPVPLLGTVPAVGVLTYFFLFLFLRLSDELKDQRADRVHFPDRCVPSGRVSLAWVRGAWGGSLVIVLLLQIPVGFGPAFLFVAGYAVLMSRYFFLRRWIAPNLLLAFVTHNPVGFFLNLYGVSLFSEVTGHPTLEPFHLGLAFLLWLPAPVWEMARKIRAPAEETDYQTYSAILGPRRATAGAAAGAVLFAILALAAADATGLGPFGRVGLVLVTGAFVGRCLWFAAGPEPGRARLRAPAEGWALASLFVWCLDLLATQQGIWTPL